MRPLKRLIQHDIVNLFATAILEDKIPSHSQLLLKGHEKNGQFQINYEIKK